MRDWRKKERPMHRAFLATIRRFQTLVYQTYQIIILTLMMKTTATSTTSTIMMNHQQAPILPKTEPRFETEPKLEIDILEGLVKEKTVVSNKLNTLFPKATKCFAKAYKDKPKEELIISNLKALPAALEKD